MNAEQDTYPTPVHGWTCFHCGEHFPGTFAGSKAARDHFGPTPDWKPHCSELRTVAEDHLLNAARMTRVAYMLLQQEMRELRENEDGRRDAEAALLSNFCGATSIYDVRCRYESMEGRALTAEAILKLMDKRPDLDVGAARNLICIHGFSGPPISPLPAAAASPKE